ncbi:NRAMP family divalent metal transporter [Psychrobacter sp. FDAARGOS_221]|uniref:NRAMP family divalent metal transporter n=1 Tax=Psychrobacter sp. FDAARGOS_221 TaxID=1975705 RepID=UPI000BB59E93|nr:divalent metal cation transporter [Psychrobacter sp. FDAARGOS_221]PNK59632.1 divalent metal cation transporter [Psychrobacter sp. FDAARGOS_221]
MSDASKNSQKFSWRIFGPGILLATGAVGGSHLISSTQAGALYGWQLAIIIVLANFFKYPFFKFSTDYVYDTGESLIAGYARKSGLYLWVYTILLLASAVISVGALSLLTSVILSFMLPEQLTPASTVLSALVLGSSWILLILGHYKLLDRLNKWIMATLIITTILAVLVAAGKPTAIIEGYVPTSPWNMASLAFIVALMGWMPAPLEFAAMTSMWTKEKVKTDHTTHRQGLIDFNAGYISSAILALFFLALGVFVQYGSGVPVEMQGGAYITQLFNMYTATIGDWSRLLVAFVAFMVMYGTTIACIDGYGRSLAESTRLIKGQADINNTQILFWTTYTVIGSFIIITFFKGQLGAMLKFAMISAFLLAPVFGWLNYSLVKSQQRLSGAMTVYSVTGLLFLAAVALLFLMQLTGILS